MSKLKIFLLMIMLSVTACFGSVTAEDSVIIIEASQESAAKRDEVIASSGNVVLKEEDFEILREKLLSGVEQSFPEVTVENLLEKESWNGSDVYTLSNGEDYQNIVLFIHGGAWIFGISPEHVDFCDKLVNRLNAKIYMPLYPLAPRYSYQETYEMVRTLYQNLLEQDKPIYLIGDSAGGNITFGLLYQLKEKGTQMPVKVVALHPCVDMTFSNPQIAEIEDKDPILTANGARECAKMWVGDMDLTDPLLSPLFADVSGYPDILMFDGTNDILMPDDELMVEKLREAGNNVTLVRGNGLWHVFATYDIPEQPQALDIIEEFCK